MAYFIEFYQNLERHCFRGYDQLFSSLLRPTTCHKTLVTTRKLGLGACRQSPTGSQRGAPQTNEEVRDETFKGPGLVGLWTKADSVMLCDDFRCGVR